MTKQRCQFFGIVTGRRLDLIPEPYRSLFAMWRCADAKRANKPRRDRDLLNRKLRDIERLKRDLARGGPKRITHTGELACECRWCSVQKPILQFPWKGEGYGFRAECTTCYHEFIAAARKRSPYKEREAERRRTNQLAGKGELPRTPCVACGHPDAERHHTRWDGSGRHIAWLCKPCHDREHARVGPRSATRLDYRHPPHKPRPPPPPRNLNQPHSRRPRLISAI